MLERNKLKKTICMPAHLDDGDALHVAEQANDRGWSNSAYIRYLVKQDRKRHLDDLYLTNEVYGESSERFDLCEQNERKLKSPVAVTTELGVQNLKGNEQ